jgi:hypothetical protein
MIDIFLAGVAGGLIRGLLGIAKAMTASPSKKAMLSKQYILLTLLASGGLGLFTGIFIANDVRFALLAGYAGTDFLDNLFKIKLKKLV